MDQLKGSSTSVDNTLRRLDKVSHKELNKALKQLQNQLNGIQRGIPAWNVHIAKIKPDAAKKQQQASEVQGYAEGGFTPPDGKYEEAGVVYKVEWVASQRLVNNSRTRPLLEALYYAQRTNTIGSITDYCRRCVEDNNGSSRFRFRSAKCSNRREQHLLLSTCA